MSELTTYDEVPYPSLATWYTHPAVMAQRALLLGMEPARLATCRVLELGAGPGGNIIPIADQLPRARFLGIDLSAVHVAAGRAMADEMGLANVELRHASILDIDATDGPFDYIICHGVYSWVPPAVQERILWACASLLSENGLACVSYNCLPGWFLQGMLRNIMLRESRFVAEPERRLDRALEAMHALATDLESVDNVRAKHLREEIALFDRHARGYLFHEYLEEHNEPLYFYQFIERMERHGLAYLGDLTPIGHRDLPDLASPNGASEADLFARLQRDDILGDRRFRCSLLCRSSSSGPLRLAPSAVLRLHATCSLRDVTVEMSAHEPLKLSRGDGPVHTPSRPVEKAFRALTEHWPAALPVAELWQRAQATDQPDAPDFAPAADTADGEGAFAHGLYELYQARIVELHAARPLTQSAKTPNPNLRRLNLLEARRGRSITNPWHHHIIIADHERTMVPWLDGRPRGDLLPLVANALRSGEFPPGQDDPDDLAPRIVDVVVTGMADCGMLVEPGPEGRTLDEWR